MRYGLFLLILVLVISCDQAKDPITQSDDPVVGHWVLHVPAQGAIVKREDFEIWSIHGDQSFTKHEILKGRCTGSNGVWETTSGNLLRIPSIQTQDSTRPLLSPIASQATS